MNFTVLDNQTCVLIFIQVHRTPRSSLLNDTRFNIYVYCSSMQSFAVHNHAHFCIFAMQKKPVRPYVYI